MGHLYSANEERGVYKTTDGGTTWTKSLFVNENAGAIDLVIDPQDPAILYAATWERTRRAWNFTEAGSGSGIYKSINGGNTWNKISGDPSGFPGTAGTGRIGLSCSVENGNTVLFAVLDNYDRRAKEEKEKSEGLTKEDFRNMTNANFSILDDKKLQSFLEDNKFPEKYSAKKVKSMVANGKMKPNALVEYLEDANSLLFDTPVIGAELYRSNDQGTSWSKTHDGFLDDLFYSYGYYFAQVRSHPTNPDEVYLFGVPVVRSIDGGKTFSEINADNVHSDHHACWINPDREGHVIIGNDGGVNISYDAGEHWIKCNSPAVGQFYSVTLDNATPYNIYGGLQDNGVWKGPSNYKARDRWHSTGQYPYKGISGGDGMQVAVDLRDNNTVYTGFQFGNYFRIDVENGDRKYITPKHELGERPLRWNWQSPIHLSVHNQDIFYMGSNKVHRSFNQANDFEAISDDLTKGGRKGDVAFGTLSSIHESPLKFGLLYAGSDDGLVHCSQDAGQSWTKCNTGLPADRWVVTVQASSHKKSRVYLAMNGYRWDDFMAYAYVSEDYGNSWRSIAAGIPAESINVIHEDEKNENILYIGTDHGLYISLDRGTTWQSFQANLPAVSVHDIAIHDKTEEIILGTHGRSFWKGSVKEIRQMDSELMNNALYAFDIDKIKRRNFWGNSWSQWYEPNLPEIDFLVYANAQQSLTIEIKDSDGLTVMKWKEDAKRGINKYTTDLSTDGAVAKKLNAKLEKKDQVKVADNEQWYLPKGTYEVTISGNGSTTSTSMTIK